MFDILFEGPTKTILAVVLSPAPKSRHPCLGSSQGKTLTASGPLGLNLGAGLPPPEPPPPLVPLGLGTLPIPVLLKPRGPKSKNLLGR